MPDSVDFCSDLGLRVKRHITSTGNFCVFPACDSSFATLRLFDYYSNGIRLCVAGLKRLDRLPLLDSFLRSLRHAHDEFSQGRFGTFYAPDESPTLGWEYGEYDTVCGKVWLHRTYFERITVYFPYEN